MTRIMHLTAKKGLGLALALAGMQPSLAAGGYPTEETIRYVLDCMAEFGQQNDHNMYTCVCRHDVITREIPVYEHYDGARVYERYKVMPGEKGGFFRDSKLGESYYEKLVAAREVAVKECPKVRHLEARKPDPDKEVKTLVE